MVPRAIRLQPWAATTLNLGLLPVAGGLQASPLQGKGVVQSVPQLECTNAGVTSPLVGPGRLFTPAGDASLDPEALLLEAGPPLAALRFGVLTL